MGWNVYEFLCKLFLEGEDDEYTFVPLVYNLKWNLISCSENIMDGNAKNIFWVEDSLGLQFRKLKADQLGKRSNEFWHIYATPELPYTCSHLFVNP